MKILDLNVEVIPESLKASVEKASGFRRLRQCFSRIKKSGKALSGTTRTLYVSDFDDTLLQLRNGIMKNSEDLQPIPVSKEEA